MRRGGKSEAIWVPGWALLEDDSADGIQSRFSWRRAGRGSRKDDLADAVGHDSVGAVGDDSAAWHGGGRGNWDWICRINKLKASAHLR